MLDFLARAKPLEPVKFPNGNIRAVRVLDAEGWALVRKAQATGMGEDAMAALQYCVPDATTEDLGTLGVEDVGVLLLYCGRQIIDAENGVKNSSGGAAATPTPPSPSLTTSSAS